MESVFKDIQLLHGLSALNNWISSSSLQLDSLCLAIAIGGDRGEDRKLIAESLDKIKKPILIARFYKN